MKKKKKLHIDNIIGIIEIGLILVLRQFPRLHPVCLMTVVS